MDKEDVNERERKRAMKIIIDADACPVQDVVIEESAKRGKDVILVKSYAHYSNVEQEAEVIYVDPGNDSADYKIVQLAVPGDIIITQDYGLAALALEKNCKVLHHTGFYILKIELMRCYLNAINQRNEEGASKEFVDLSHLQMNRKNISKSNL
ncbi:hypothetical protein JCM19055_294 [Geomicrobium sp. JCM 19055]|nr:hypothetical protein JCM19055_294 [Geomicrobium sp. JCM 19055]